MGLRNHLVSGGASASGILGGIGSVPNVCHSLCVASVSVLSLFGITLNILPLMFLEQYRLYFWFAAAAFTLASLFFFLRRGIRPARDRNFLLLNVGLLTFGIPFQQVTDFLDFFRFAGASMAVAGIALLVLGKRLQVVEAAIDSASPRQPAVHSVAAHRPHGQRRLSAVSVLITLIIGTFLVNQFLLYKKGLLSVPLQSSAESQAATRSMKLTAFDVALAKELMDANGDGVCDACGMKVQQCIDSGQLECTMGNKPNAIGVLGSAHNHADFKVFADGQPLNFAKPEHYMRSSFLHLDDNRNQDDAGGVLHMHAMNVPLWVFFRSIGMKLTEDSLTLADGTMLTNGNGKTLKFYVNGQSVNRLDDYVFQDLDKLLISFGLESDPGVEEQLASLTNFARDH